MDDMFTKEEAFSFIKNKLEVKDAEGRMKTDRRSLLDDIIVAIHGFSPFQCVRLLSVPPKDRCQPTLEHIKSDFMNGIGGLCFNVNICGFFLFKAIGFDVSMAYGTCSTTVRFHHNHAFLYLSNVEKPGDRFLVEMALGHPTFQAINLDFETESPIYVSSYLEYKYVKHDGKLLRMHRKGDKLADCTRPQNPEIDFWIGDFRRMYEAEIESTTDITEFDKSSSEVFTNPRASPFHLSHRFIIFKGRKASIVINGKALIENDQGELESRDIPGGDDGIVAAIRELCPNMTEEMIRKSLVHWRQAVEENNN